MKESSIKILKKIGQGGVGIVYLAELSTHSDVIKKIALKRLHPHLAILPEMSGKILEEARIGTRLNHPNIVSVIGVHESDEFGPELIQEWVDGKTLREFLTDSARQGTRLNERKVLEIAIQLASALKYAHSLDPKVLHGDLSPQNIMITPLGNIKLLDFGAARILATEADSTVTEEFTGKLSYSAPESLASGKYSAKSDVYSLGVILAEALLDRRLTRSDLDQIQKSDLNELSNLKRSKWVTILEKMLATNPDDRPVAEDLLRVLEAMRSKRQVRVFGLGWLLDGWQSSRKPIIAIVFGAMCIAGLSFGISSYRTHVLHSKIYLDGSIKNIGPGFFWKEKNGKIHDLSPAKSTSTYLGLNDPEDAINCRRKCMAKYVGFIYGASKYSPEPLSGSDFWKLAILSQKQRPIFEFLKQKCDWEPACHTQRIAFEMLFGSEEIHGQIQQSDTSARVRRTLSRMKVLEKRIDLALAAAKLKRDQAALVRENELKSISESSDYFPFSAVFGHDAVNTDGVFSDDRSCAKIGDIVYFDQLEKLVSSQELGKNDLPSARFTIYRKPNSIQNLGVNELGYYFDLLDGKSATIFSNGMCLYERKNGRRDKVHFWMPKNL